MRKPCGTFDESYDQDFAIVRTRAQWGWLIFALLLCMVVPLFASRPVLSFLIYVGISIIVALGLNILTGYCGQVSTGHSAFMGVGAFAAAHLSSTLLNGSAWSFWIALPVSGIMAGLVGLIFGFPSLRIRGMYLALTTLAAQFIISYVLVHFAGGTTGVYAKSPQIGSFVFNTDSKFYYLMLSIALLSIFVAKNLVRGRVGRGFIMVRDNDIAAEGMGINNTYYKLLAFFIGCFYAGVGGCLWTYYVGLASVEHYTLWSSIWYLGMVIIGGMGSISGTIMGVFFIRALQEGTAIIAPQLSKAIPALSGTVIGALPILVFSLVMVLFLLFEPRGLAHRWEIIKSWYRLWPFGYR